MLGLGRLGLWNACPHKDSWNVCVAVKIKLQVFCRMQTETLGFLFSPLHPSDEQITDKHKISCIVINVRMLVCVLKSRVEWPSLRRITLSYRCFRSLAAWPQLLSQQFLLLQQEDHTSGQVSSVWEFDLPQGCLHSPAFYLKLWSNRKKKRWLISCSKVIIV